MCYLDHDVLLCCFGKNFVKIILFVLLRTFRAFCSLDKTWIYYEKYILHPPVQIKTQWGNTYILIASKILQIWSNFYGR